MSDLADKKAEGANADINVRPGASNADTSSLPERLQKAIAGAGGIGVVARLIGVSSKTLSRYLRGAPAKHSTLQQLAAATQVRLEWLTSGEGPMRPGEAPPPPPAPAPPAAPPAKPAPLFSSVNMDRLADAYAAARQLLAARGIVEPRAIDLVRIMSTIYDELTDVEGRDRTS